VQPLSLLCKASPLIDELALYDVVNTPGVAADLSHISSIAKITGYLPKDDGLKHALTGADICIIPAGIPRKQFLSPHTRRVHTHVAQESLA
jgi:malate dehydrogenase